MPSIDILLLFTLSAILMNLSPGPSNLYVMSRSLSQGVKGGVMAALGLALGSLVFVMGTALGLARIFENYPEIYLILKLTGGAYLLYLGYNYISTNKNNSNDTIEVLTPKSYRQILKESFFVEITNPKSALFFITFLPQFVDTEAGALWPQLLVLGFIVTLSAVPCDLIVAFFSAKSSEWIAKNKNMQVAQERVSGIILISLGAYVLLGTNNFLGL